MEKLSVEQAFKAVGVAWFDSDFEEWFLPMSFSDKKVKPLIGQKLPRDMTSAKIQEELKPSLASLEEIAATLKTMNPSVSSLFYCKDKDGVPRLVCAYWYDDNAGWGVFASDASCSGLWGDEHQLFSSNSRGTQTLNSSEKLRNMKCPYCKTDAKWVPNEEVYGNRFGNSYMCYWCKDCDAYVGCHQNTRKPLGTMANKELRQWRMKAHAAIDPLWKSKKWPRWKVYQTLSDMFGREIHIGESDIETCKEIIHSVEILLGERLI